MKKVWFYLAQAIALACLLAGCGISTAAPPSPTEKAAVEKPPVADGGGFSIDLLSTGKSDCAIIRMDGFVILNDTADEDDYDKIASALKAGGVTRIDYMILSHYDKDHIGSAASIIHNFEVGMILRPDCAKESERYNALIEAENAANVPVVILKENYAIATANGSITVDPPKEDYGDDNNNSAITTVTYRGHRLLFPGDAKKKRLEAFSSSFQDACDFIKLPHHGDGNKALYSLMRDCGPRWVAATVASSGDVEPKLTKTLDMTKHIVRPWLKRSKPRGTKPKRWQTPRGRHWAMYSPLRKAGRTLPPDTANPRTLPLRCLPQMKRPAFLRSCRASPRSARM